MLSVTALLHGDRDPSIAGMVLDSPFADLTQLCEEMVEKARDHGISKFSCLLRRCCLFSLTHSHNYFHVRYFAIDVPGFVTVSLL